MIDLFLIAITWYATRLYYTRSLKESDIVKSTCFKCARSIYTTRDNLRAPYYCMSCK